MTTTTASGATPSAQTLDHRSEIVGPAETFARPNRSLRVTQWRVIRSEWIKLRSVSSNRLALLVAIVFPVVMGGVFASTGDGGPVHAIDSLSLSLAGFKIVQLLVGVLGITLVTSEYSNGLIRLTLQSVRSRSSVVWAKATVFALVVLVVACFAAPAAFVVGRATYSGTAPAYSLGDSGVVRVIAGTIVYLVSIGLLGVALGFLIRSAAAAVGVLFASLLIVPALVGLLPGTVADTVTKLLPSNAGDALTSITRSSDLLSPVAGGIVLIVWVVGVLVAAVAVLQRRDA